MECINNNPFRILDLPITASEREIAKQVSTLSTYAEMGKLKSMDINFSFLPLVLRTPDSIEEAKKQIEQTETKLLYSLFWFWKNNSVDELAFELLKEGNTGKAIDVWEKTIFINKHKDYKPIITYDNLLLKSTKWLEQENERHALTKNEGEYVIMRKVEKSYSIPTIPYNVNDENNWSIECDTIWKGGISNYGYGIVFGRMNNDYFSFQISGEGSYCFEKSIDGAITKLLDWKRHSSINKRSSNNIKISKVGDTITFIVNGTNIHEFGVEPFYGQNFGFKVNGKQTITFRNFIICKPKEDESSNEGILVSSKNISNIKNLSTLYLGLSLSSPQGSFNFCYFKKGIDLSKYFFANGNVEEYSKLIAGHKHIYNPEKVIHYYINDILESIKIFLDKPNGISTKQLIHLFSKFPIEAKQFLNNKFVTKRIHSIDKEIENSKSARKNSASTSTTVGKQLAKNTMHDIEYLRKLLFQGDYQYQSIADKLSSEIVQCGIDEFNFYKTDKGEIDYARAIKSEEGYIKEYEYALQIAVSQNAIDKAKENLDSCKQFIENKQLYSCWFCGENPPTEESKFEITVYKTTSRNSFGIEYKYVPVSINRCKACEVYHSHFVNFTSQTKDYNWSEEIGILNLIAIIFLLIIDGLQFVWVQTANLIVRTVFKFYMPSMKEIRSTSHSSIRHFPPLKKMLNEAWQFSKPKV